MRWYNILGERVDADLGRKLLDGNRVILTTSFYGILIVTKHTVLAQNCDCGCEKGIFETKILGGTLDGDIRRHHSLKDAHRGHNKIVHIQGMVL